MAHDNDPFGLVGTVLERKFRIDAVVGEGGFGVVYRGFHLSFQQPIAVKCLKIPHHFTPDAQVLFVSKFREEGQHLARLSAEHVGIVRVFDFDIVAAPRGGSMPFLVLEWLEGQSLEDALRDRRTRGERPYAEGEALALLRPAIEALGVAHQQGVAHRDVKPANLFLVKRPDGATRVKLLDFGIAKAMQEGETATQLVTRTSSGFSAFSPHYGAPEQFSTKRYGATGPWTDVHALALCVVEMMTGEPPYGVDADPSECMLGATADQRATPRAKGAQVSDGLEAVCSRALARAPKERFPHAGAMLAAIDAALAEAQKPGSSGVGRAPPSAPAKVAPTIGSGTVIAPTALPLATDGPPGPRIERRREEAPLLPKRSSPWLWVAVATVAGGAAVVGLVASTGGKKAETPAAVDSAVPIPTASETASAAAPVAPSSPCPEGMAVIPAGKFQMGSNDGDADEKPMHEVSLASFCMDFTEVTVGAYGACARTGKCVAAPTTTSLSDTFWNQFCNGDREDRQDHPVNCVDWNQAEAFCNAAGKRLPTEEEWEYGARGGEGKKYPWGDAPPGPKLLNACGDECVALGKRLGKTWTGMYSGSDGFETTAPVKSYPEGRSPFGLWDMAGNVWEWTSSPYTKSYKKDDTASNDRADAARVYRGGGWFYYDPSFVRGAVRHRNAPADRVSLLGFRCARNIP